MYICTIINKQTFTMKTKINSITTVYTIQQSPFNFTWKELYKSFQTKKILGFNLNLNPPYQRGARWTEKQQIQYIEYCLKGGTSGRMLFLNLPCLNSEKNTVTEWEETAEIVDGLQRLTAIFQFMDNKLKILGEYYADDLDLIDARRNTEMQALINNLQTPKEVAQWYISMNTGGAIHTAEDIKIAIDYINGI